MWMCNKCGATTDDILQRCVSCHARRLTIGDGEDVRSSSPRDAAAVATSAGHRVAMSVLTRYRDAYRVAGAIVGVGGLMKGVALVAMAGVAFTVVKFGDYPLELRIIVAGIGIIVGLMAWIAGVIIAAHGQLLRATLDTAVNGSPFLTDQQRIEAQGLSGPKSEYGTTDHGGRPPSQRWGPA